MTKRELKTKQTNLSTNDASGHQVEEIFTIDDNFLPSPQELIQYKEINPDIVKLLLDASEREQIHRHFIDKQKMKVIYKDSRSMHSINILGMIFAFIVILSGLALSAYLIHLEKNTIGTIFAGSTIIIAAAIFLNHSKKREF